MVADPITYETVVGNPWAFKFIRALEMYFKTQIKYFGTWATSIGSIKKLFVAKKPPLSFLAIEVKGLTS